MDSKNKKAFIGIWLDDKDQVKLKHATKSLASSQPAAIRFMIRNFRRAYACLLKTTR